MAIVGAYLGGGSAIVPAGQAQILCRWNTEDRQNIAGAVFTAQSSSGSYQANGNDTGYAELTVPAGRYTISVQHTGAYSNDGPQELIVESSQVYIVLFDAYNRNPVDDALSGTSVNAVQNKVITAELGNKLSLDGTAYAATRDSQGRNIVDTYLTKDEYEGTQPKIENVSMTYSTSVSSGVAGTYVFLESLKWSVPSPSRLNGLTATCVVTATFEGTKYNTYENIITMNTTEFSLTNSELKSGGITKQLPFSRGLFNRPVVFMVGTGSAFFKFSDGTTANLTF